MSVVHDPEVAAAVSLEYLPWHASARARLAAAIAGGRMPHALLLHGAEGLGKERFAATLAAGLLCIRPGPELMPCGSCADCSLSRAGSHPDLHWLRIPDDRKSNQKREICVRTWPLYGMGLAITTSNALIRSVATMMSLSPRS